MEINIKKAEYGFDVYYEDKLADSLTWDEMLGLVASITMPEKKPCLQWLKTREEKEAQKQIISSLKK